MNLFEENAKEMSNEMSKFVSENNAMDREYIERRRKAREPHESNLPTDESDDRTG